MDETRNLSWAVLCLISLRLQVRGVLLAYFKAKPVLVSSLRDCVDCDAAHAFQACLSVYIFVDLLISLDVSLSFYPAFVLCHSADLFGTLFFLYLAAGVIVRYAQVKLRTIDIFGNERKAHHCIRLFLGTMSTFVVGGRCYAGAYGITFPLLLNDHTIDIKIHISFVVMSCIVLTSLLLNIVLRVIIWIEKHQGDCGTPAEQVWKDLSGNKYVLLSLLLLVLITANALAMASGEKGGNVRDFTIGLCCIAVPFMVNVTNRKIRNFAIKKLLETVPALTSLKKLRKMDVSPAA